MHWYGSDCSTSSRNKAEPPVDKPLLTLLHYHKLIKPHLTHVIRYRGDEQTTETALEAALEMSFTQDVILLHSTMKC